MPLGILGLKQALNKDNFRKAGNLLNEVGTATGLVEGEREKRLREEQEKRADESSKRADAFAADARGFVGAPHVAPQIGQRPGAPMAPSVPGMTGPARSPAPAGAFSAGSGGGVRGQQSQLNDAILARALGQGGPSPAAIQAEQARQASMANQMALAAANRGSTVGGASRLAALGTAQLQSQAAGQGALLRVQEQQAAQGLASQALGQTRGQDIQTDIANLQAQISTMGLNQQQSEALLRASLMERGLSMQQIELVLQQNAARQAGNRQLLGGGIDAGVSGLSAAFGGA